MLIECYLCKGKGKYKVTFSKDCPICGGTRKETIDAVLAIGLKKDQEGDVICRFCSDEGERECEMCKGTGLVDPNPNTL